MAAIKSRGSFGGRPTPHTLKCYNFTIIFGSTRQRALLPQVEALVSDATASHHKSAVSRNKQRLTPPRDTF